VLPVIANGNPFDIDRHLTCVLATKGTTIYYPSPSIGVASHSDRESVNLGRTKEAEQWWKRTTREILKLAKDAHIDLPAAFESLLRESMEDVPTLLSHAYFDGSRSIQDELPMPESFNRASRRLRLALRLRRYLPPAALKLLGLSDWMARNLPHQTLA
jgi:hypothetical protein